MSEKTLLQAKSDAKRSKNYKEFGKTCLALGAHYRGKSILDKAFKVRFKLNKGKKRQNPSI